MMRRIQQRNPTELQIGIAAALVLVFAADLLLPLGIGVWVLYLVPLALCLFGWRPATPILVAATATVFMAIGFFKADADVSRYIALTNRSFAILTVWSMGLIIRVFMSNRLLVQEQQWLRKGQTGLAECMQGEQLLPEMGDKVIRFICEYLQAQVGVIYFSAGHGVFERFGAFAFDAAQHSRTGFRAGEGLAGQTVLDKNVRQIDDVPSDYIQVSSTLGAHKPRRLLIAPAVADGQVEGVVEIGLIHDGYSSDVQFLQLISEPLGMAVRASKYRTRLEELLQETQRQAEELQAQTEELRVANEQLEQHSGMLKDSQTRLETQQVELEETNAQLEQQTQSLEAQKEELSVAKSELIRRASELARASRYKSEFLANMSHELRTPLNSTLILAKLLYENKSGNLTPDQVKFAQTIYSAGNDLLDLINDILDIAKIEAGKITLQAERILIGRLFDSLAGAFHTVAKEKKLQFAAIIDDDAPEWFVSDIQRVQQILKNLLSNALKFTETGSVTLRAARAAENAVAFSVTDTGIGIAPDQQEVIFEAFRQAEGGANRRYGGTGLGLSISRDLAKALGGSITVESTIGEGSTFVLTLPVESTGRQAAAAAASTNASPAVPAEPAAPKTPPSTPKLKPAPRPLDDRDHLVESGRILLVIEDDERFAAVLRDLAHEEGFQCLIGATAADGLELARRYLPKAAVLDINLPDNSGLYVLDQLKQAPATRHIPVHVVSVADYAHEALGMGAVTYAIKPVRREEIVAALRRVEERLDQAVRRVLIIEDDATQRESICRLLESPGIEMTPVGTASEALDKLKESVFDCVVMDLGLGDMSGYELLDQLAAEGAHSFPPVIIYTGRNLQPVDEQRLRRYSKSIIIKGARSPERLLDEVTLFLHQVEAHLPSEQQKILQMVRNRDAMLEGRRILVVEDDVRNLFALASILEPKGVKMEIARTGKEAIAALERFSRTGERVDLVLMDVMMPDMDGLTATREIRSRPEWARLPIIALTAKAMPDDREHCIRAGANDYIAKPLDVDRLVSLIRVWLPKS